VNTQINADREEIEAARSDFERAVDADVAYLTSLSDLSSGELKNLVSNVVAGYLEQTLGRYYGYARRVKGYADKRPDQSRAGRLSSPFLELKRTNSSPSTVCSTGAETGKTT